jgi:hypothetical protein
MAMERDVIGQIAATSAPGLCTLCASSERLSLGTGRCLSCVEREKSHAPHQGAGIAADRLSQAVASYHAELERSIKLQMVIEDLSQRLAEQRQFSDKPERYWRELENECVTLRRFANRKRNQMQELVWVIKTFRDRNTLGARYCDVLLEIIDEAQIDAKMPLRKASHDITALRADLATSTIQVLHLALTMMSRFVNVHNIVRLIGTADNGTFVEWMIKRAEDVDEQSK